VAPRSHADVLVHISYADPSLRSPALHIPDSLPGLHGGGPRLLPRQQPPIRAPSPDVAGYDANPVPRYRLKSDFIDFRPRTTPHALGSPSIPRAAFRLRKLKSDCNPSPTLSPIEHRRKQMARPSTFHFVQLTRRPEMVGTEALPPTHQFVVHAPMLKMRGMPSWPCSIAVEWQLSHSKGVITVPK
jgi:hypothetical protein